MLPGDVEAMFQQALRKVAWQPGVRRQKRGYQHWISTPTVKEMYRFGNACLSCSLTDCPWCTLDNQGVIYFIDLAKRSLPPVVILCWRKSGRWYGVSSTASIAIAITRSFPTDGRPLPLGLLRREYIILIEIACQLYRCCFAVFRQNRVILFCSCAGGYLDYWQSDKQSL